MSKKLVDAVEESINTPGTFLWSLYNPGVDPVLADKVAQNWIDLYERDFETMVINLKTDEKPTDC